MFGYNQLLDATLTRNTTILTYGQVKLWTDIKLMLGAHNEMVRDMVGVLVDFTGDARRRYSTSTGPNRMQRGTEWSRPLAQKAGTTPQDLGFPLELWQYGLGFTYDYLSTRSPEDALAQITAALEADVERNELQIKHALMDGVNYTFEDSRVDYTTLYVKALANGDGFPILRGPNNVTFNASTHNHYLGVSGLTENALAGLVNHVLEHDNRGKLVLYITLADADTVSGYTKFKAVTDTRILYAPGGTVDYASPTQIGTTDNSQTGNRLIGFFREAEVWVKPWVPTNYVFCVRVGAGIAKPLAYRTRSGAGPTGNAESFFGALRMEAQWEDHPLLAEAMSREFGIGVQDRVNCAILYTGNATYAAPTLE